MTAFCPVPELPHPLNSEPGQDSLWSIDNLPTDLLLSSSVHTLLFKTFHSHPILICLNMTQEVDGVRCTHTLEYSAHVDPSCGQATLQQEAREPHSSPPFLHCPYLPTCHHCSTSIKANAAESGQNCISKNV